MGSGTGTAGREGPVGGAPGQNSRGGAAGAGEGGLGQEQRQPRGPAGRRGRGFLEGTAGEAELPGPGRASRGSRPVEAAGAEPAGTVVRGPEGLGGGGSLTRHPGPEELAWSTPAAPHALR